MKNTKHFAFFVAMIMGSMNGVQADEVIKNQTTTQSPTQTQVSAEAKSKAHPEVQYSLDKDGRKWKIGYEAKNNDQSIREFIQDNETVDNWTELFTIHHYFNVPNIDLDKYNEAFITELQKIVPDSKIEHRIISKDKDSLFGEWWLENDTPQAQHEWFKVFTDGNDVIVLRYTTRKLDSVDKVKKIWEEILNDAHLIKDPAAK